MPTTNVFLQNGEKVPEAAAVNVASPGQRVSNTTATNSTTNGCSKRNIFVLACLLCLLLLVVILSVVLTSREGSETASSQQLDRTSAPTTSPVWSPTISPTLNPTVVPTFDPTVEPTDVPTPEPTDTPTAVPSVRQSLRATSRPVVTVGECADDDPCQLPAVCVLGECRSSRLDDEQECQGSSDCATNRCGRAEYTEDAPNICCPNGDGIKFESRWSINHVVVCSGASENATCIDNRNCDSRVCINKKCAAARAADLEECDDLTDCASNMCGLAYADQNAPLICCPQGDALFLNVEWNTAHAFLCSHVASGNACMHPRSCESGICASGVCTDARKADGENCTTDSSCESGYCGHEEATVESPTVCCPDGLAQPKPVELNSVVDHVCGKLAVNATCVADMNCESGTCSLGVCQVEPAPDGSSCDSNNDCATGRCGREEYGDEKMLCCPEGKASARGVPFQFICDSSGRGQSVDTKNEGVSCDDADGNPSDLLCASRACGKAAFSEAAENVCCPPGEQYRLNEAPWIRGPQVFCGSMSDGTACFDDRMCTSLCVNKVCSSKRLSDMQNCEEDSDCVSRACAKSSFEEFSPKVCCPNKESYLFDAGEWSSAQEEFCGNLPLGTICGYNRMCESGLCIEGVCSQDVLPDGSRCKEDSDCENRACALEEHGASARKCCIDGIKVKLFFQSDNQDSWYCGDVRRPIRSDCSADSQCESGACVLNSCT